MSSLTPEEEELVRERVATVRRLMPEFVAFFSECYRSGMVDGWRALSSVTVLLEAQCPLDSAGGSSALPVGRLEPRTSVI